MASLKNLTCGAIDPEKIGAWFEWVKNWRQDSDRETPKPLLLTDLPITAINLILDKITLRDRFNVRSVCRSLKRATDDRSTQYKNMKIQFMLSHAFLKLDSLDLQRPSTSPSWVFDDRITHFKTSFGELHAIFKVSKFRLDTLHFLTERMDSGVLEFDHRWYIQPTLFVMKSFVANLPRQLHVKDLVIGYWSIDVLHILLPSLKPGVLKTIKLLDLKCANFHVPFDRKKQLLKEVSECTQWKQLETITINCDKREFYFVPGNRTAVICSHKNVNFIKEVMNVMQPHQTLVVFAGHFSKSYIEKLQEISEVETSFDVDFRRAADFNDLSDHIRIQKK